ncbi:DEKNAAC101187 [Brettanomyces naardenensis]|uniref:Phosphoglycerate mutase n=1 Tax=Brettanomyces naardenensis TaxID=13370 RepID=A0A448YHK7_BRENA|nr:DEKNAAC101187 [Brettanomyces naardenensis]
MPQIIILRHGESEWNKSNKFCGWVDVQLSANGKQQAVKSAELILEQSDVSIPDVCFTSRLTRANQTTGILLDKLRRPFIDTYKTWRLNERHYGALQGRDKTEVLNEFGKEKYMFWRRAYTGCPPLCDKDDEWRGVDDRYIIDAEDEAKMGLKEELPYGESLQMVVSRLIPYYNVVISEHLRKGRTVLIVTHGSVVRALLKVLYDISDDAISEVNIPNGIPIKINLDQDTLKPVSDKWVYLDPERAKVEAEKVRLQGFTKV